MKVYFLIVILFTCCRFATAQYVQDILGKDYVQRTIVCQPDQEGEVVATLVKKDTVSSSEVGVLYVHGYNDYFFQRHVGDSVAKNGYPFYALDLRKYGRSILDHQTLYDCKNLKEYHEEIDSAIHIMRNEGVSKVVLYGHSTGGLIVSHYYLHHQKKGYINGLILNSPFFDFNLNRAIENLGVDIVSYEGKKHPDKEMKQSLNPNYGESLHKDYKGIWDYNLKWKSIISPNVKYGWIKAINDAQHELHGVNFQVPILLMSSDKSYKKSKWSDDIQIRDAVLDVNDIKRVGLKLGPDVQYSVVNNGKHDLVLSNKNSQHQFFQYFFKWLENI